MSALLIGKICEIFYSPLAHSTTNKLLKVLPTKSPTKIPDTQTNDHNNALSVPTPVLATATSEFKCPLCIKILPTNKGIVNHCYKKHRYSVVKGKYINEITAGTAARSSDSGRDTPAVSLSV